MLAVNRRIPSYHASRHPNLVPSFFEPVTTAEVGTAPNGGTTVEATVLEGQHSLRGLPRSTDSETSRDSPWSAPRRRLSWQCIAAVNGEVGSGQSAASVTFVQVTTVVTTTDQGRFAALLAMLAMSAANGTGTHQNAITNAAGQSLTQCDNAWLEGTQRQVIPAPAPPPPRPNAALGGLRLEDFVNVTNPGMAALGALMAQSAGTIQSAVGASVGVSAAASAAGGGGPSGAGNAVRGAQRLAYYTKLGPPNPDGDDGGGGGFTTGRLGFSRRRPGPPPPPPTYQVAIGFVAAEPIEAFTDARLADISTSVAAESGVDPSQVTTVAYAASTPDQLVSRALSEALASDADSSEGAVGAARVEITIVTTDSSASAAVEESLSASVFADANATSAFLNLQVTSEPDVAAETVTYEDEEGEVQENVSLMLGAALVDTVTSLGSIFCLITAIHYAILFWWFMYANRKYYAYHAALRAQKAAEEAAATPQERKAKALLMAKSRRIFDQFDQDGSGFVSTSEVTRMVKMLKLGLTRSQVKEMVAAADLDMSGQISFEEFVALLKEYKVSGGGGLLLGRLRRAGRAITFTSTARVAPSAEPEYDPVNTVDRIDAAKPVSTPSPTAILQGDTPLGVSSTAPRVDDEAEDACIPTTAVQTIETKETTRSNFLQSRMPKLQTLSMDTVVEDLPSPTPSPPATASQPDLPDLPQPDLPQPKPPHFRRLPAMLRVPNVQNILGVTFAASLINVSTAVIGAQIGVEYAFSPEDYGYYILAWVVFIFTMLWYVHQVWRLEKLRRLHMSMIWSDADPPETPKDCDDPLFGLMMKVGFKARHRVKGEFGVPDEDKQEPARTERALEFAFFWPTRIMYLFGYGSGDREHITDAEYLKKKISIMGLNCCETHERPGDALERGPMWLDEAKGGRGVHYLSVQLGLQLVAGGLSGFLEAHPWKMTSAGGMGLMIALLSTQFLSLLWCAANTASDYLKSGQAITVYSMEFLASLLVFVAGLVADSDLEGSLMLAVRAADIMVYCAFVPMILMGWDNLVRPPLKMFLKGEGGTLETLYLMFIALLLIPVSIAQTMFGFGGDNTDLAMSVVGAMDMVAGDVAATADETGEEEGKKEAEEA